MKVMCFVGEDNQDLPPVDLESDPTEDSTFQWSRTLANVELDDDETEITIYVEEGDFYLSFTMSEIEDIIAIVG